MADRPHSAPVVTDSRGVTLQLDEDVHSKLTATSKTAKVSRARIAKALLSLAIQDSVLLQKATQTVMEAP